MTNETALRDALAEVFADHGKVNSLAWTEKVAGLLQSPSQPVVAEASCRYDKIADVLYVSLDGRKAATKTIEAEAVVLWRYEGGDLIGVTICDAKHQSAHPQASPPPVQGEVTQADEIFADTVWQALKGDHNDLRKQQIIIKAHRLAHSQTDTQEGERRGEKRAIARIVNVSRAIGSQAGVGGRETAGAIVSYLATSPDEIAPFVAGELSPLDFAGDLMRGGCLTWHAMNGKVVSPEDVAAALQQQEQPL